MWVTVTNSNDTRAEVVRWVSESNRPFQIVADHGFLALMKTGRPHMWIPRPTTVASDVRMVFARTRQQVAVMLQVSAITFLNQKQLTYCDRNTKAG